MNGSEYEIWRAFDEASKLNRPLQDRLDLMSTRRRVAQATYDRLVARLTKAGAGAEAPETGGQIPDFLLPDTPLKEAIFRVILAHGNEPMTAEDISEILTERWAMTAYPRDVTPQVIQRLLENSETYCIIKVPEPEDEEEEEEVIVVEAESGPVAELADGDDAVEVESAAETEGQEEAVQEDAANEEESED